VSGVSEAEWERIERLIEQSSLGTPEAKAARESVAPEIGTALALAARYLGERDDALARLAEVRALRDRWESLASRNASEFDYGRWHPAAAQALRAALGDPS